MLLEISQFSEVVTESFLPCNKCNGTGYLQQHRRISGGVCFKCDGKGTSLKTKTTVHEKIETTYVEAEVMGDDDTFESMLAKYQAKQEKLNSPDFNIFDWFES